MDIRCIKVTLFEFVTNLSELSWTGFFRINGSTTVLELSLAPNDIDGFFENLIDICPRIEFDVFVISPLTFVIELDVCNIILISEVACCSNLKQKIS